MDNITFGPELLTVTRNDNGQELRLSLVKLRNYEPYRYDLRIWKPDGKGGMRPAKGMQFTDREAARLAEAIIKQLEKGPQYDQEVVEYEDVFGVKHRYVSQI